MTTTTLKNEIRRLAHKSVHEALEAEMARIRGMLLPLVSKKEQREIEKLYKKPSHRAERSIRTRF
ncbi:hypothetical protein HYW59_01255 [Candidatus Kaiserbacteria bacterium]|nr:hypothetical protein [Candidatus Kaiserbacteria bacterium]